MEKETENASPIFGGNTIPALQSIQEVRQRTVYVFIVAFFCSTRCFERSSLCSASQIRAIEGKSSAARRRRFPQLPSQRRRIEPRSAVGMKCCERVNRKYIFMQLTLSNKLHSSARKIKIIVLRTRRERVRGLLSRPPPPPLHDSE
jgi:hypothetical protein